MFIICPASVLDIFLKMPSKMGWRALFGNRDKTKDVIFSIILDLTAALTILLLLDGCLRLNVFYEILQREFLFTLKFIWRFCWKNLSEIDKVYGLNKQKFAKQVSVLWIIAKNWQLFEYFDIKIWTCWTKLFSLKSLNSQHFI